LLDGVLETPGRIIIMTSNHPEKLDKALIRPGRIDIALNVGFCTRDMIVDMIRYFYDNKDFFIPDDEWQYTNHITPAEMNKIMLNNFDNIQKCKNELLNQTSKLLKDKS
jgi:SpoVK/Ycf46/Vps4 family AAA+-type ATPase